MDSSNSTLYKIAEEEMRNCIEAYLELIDDTDGLTDIKPEHISEKRKKIILLAGIGTFNKDISTEDAIFEWRRQRAITFDLESAITFGVYDSIRTLGMQFYQQAQDLTNNFENFNTESINANPHLLPIFQHLGGVFSKAALKKFVGSVSDNSISKPAALRLAQLLTERVNPSLINKGEILNRLESTLEGIVRDLVGRLLLESIVEKALIDKTIPFKRESEYSSLSGVVYDFRADFVIPDETLPKAFIEVRKSSSRHASLYAKDKMFSAINWKGNNTELLAILVVDGEWTGETLRVMAKVFDYVIPITRVTELVETVEAYLQGDKSRLKWLISFSIADAHQY